MKTDNAFGFWGALAIMATVFLIGLAPRQAHPMDIQFPDTRGGYLYEVLPRVVAAERSGEPVQIRTRNCLSACVLWVTVKGACVSRHTTFGFHCAKQRGRCAENDLHNRVIAARLAQFNPDLAALFDEASKSARLTRIPGSLMIDRYRAKEC